jgi:hypothetical protein
VRGLHSESCAVRDFCQCEHQCSYTNLRGLVNYLMCPLDAVKSCDKHRMYEVTAGVCSILFYNKLGL